MARQIFALHPSRTILGILERTTRTDLPDTELEVATDVEAALERLRSERFDVILCGNNLDHHRGVEIFAELREGGANAHTPFILLTATPSAENLERFQRAGIQHVLPMPFSGVALVKAIDGAYHPYEMRTHPRVQIPDLGATIHTADGAWDAAVINIGVGGMLCELSFREEVADLMGRVRVELPLPLVDGEHWLDAEAVFLRLELVTWAESGRPHTLRIGWRFVEVDEEDLAVLEDVLDREQKNAWLEES